MVLEPPLPLEAAWSWDPPFPWTPCGPGTPPLSPGHRVVLGPPLLLEAAWSWNPPSICVRLGCERTVGGREDLGKLLRPLCS